MPAATANATVTASPSRPWWLVPVAVAAVAVLALASFAATRLLVGSDSATAVTLLGADEVGQSPFTDSASTVRTEELAPVISGTADVGAIDVAEQGAAAGPIPVASDAVVVYAQVAATPCDVATLNRYLAADDAARATWAQLMGIEDQEVTSTLKALTPLVLARDTAVTNTAYTKGTSNEKRFQAVLQAGTAVLVDAHGSPRVKCSCGNPLLPPEQTGELTYTGNRWSRFDPDRVVEVGPASTSNPTLPVVDLETGRRSTTTLTHAPAPEPDPEQAPQLSPADLILRGDGLGPFRVGDDADETLTALTAILGPPTEDTGWKVLCELAGPDAPPGRVVSWGETRVLFERSVDGSGHLSGWAAGVSAGPDRLVTAQGVGPGDTMADLYRLYAAVPPTYEEMFNSFMGRLDIEGGTIDLDADGASPNARIRFLSLNQGLCE